MENSAPFFLCSRTETIFFRAPDSGILGYSLSRTHWHVIWKTKEKQKRLLQLCLVSREWVLVNSRYVLVARWQSLPWRARHLRLLAIASWDSYTVSTMDISPFLNIASNSEMYPFLLEIHRRAFLTKYMMVRNTPSHMEIRPGYVWSSNDFIHWRHTDIGI